MSKYMSFESEAFANGKLLVEALKEMGFENVTVGTDLLLQGWDKRDQRLAARLFGEQIENSESQTVSTRRILTDHLIEDVGSIVSVEDWARDLMPRNDAPFYQFLARKRGQIEAGEIKGEKELLNAFNLADEDVCAVKSFLDFPLRISAHPAALLFSHNSFAIFLAEKLFGVAFVKKNSKASLKESKKQLAATREVFERLIFQRMKAVYSPAEIVARTETAEVVWRLRSTQAARLTAGLREDF